MDEEVSGAGYAKRDITWATAELDMSASDLIAVYEQAEAENIAAVLRKFAGAFENEG